MRLATLLVMLEAAASAGGGAETEPYKDVDYWIGGIADLYLAGNFNLPASGTNQLRQFDFKANTPSINLVRLTLAHKPGRVGFRLDVGLGDTTDSYFAQDPAATLHPDVSRFFSHITQAFVTVVLPIKHYLAIDVGKFNTPVGLEDNETLTNWSYSRSLIFTFAEPTLHTGIRVTVVPTPTLGLSLYWINGWNSNFLDGSDLRTFAAAATWKPNDKLEISLVDIGGPEHPPTMLSDPHLTFRNVIDAYVLYSPLTWLSLAASFDYGNDRFAGGVNFWGVAGYVQARPKTWLSLAFRGEYFSDPDGFTTGTRQNVSEETATLDVHGQAKRLWLATLLEYRHDGSSALVFEHGAEPASRSNQHTLTLALLTRF